ncbi:LVIVD repeat-containing protein [Actinoplanes sp. NPDC000266]
MTHPQGRRLRRLAAIGAVALAAALLTAPVSGAAQAAEPNTIPGVDEIVSSPNLKQVAHRDKIGPFANSTNSDWAFQGKYAYSGNYNGFTVYDVSNPKAPFEATQVVCPGSQNDVSVSGNLLFLGTDSQRTDDGCESAGSTTDKPGARWEGIKIFDISDPLTPVHLKSVKTDCGSHTQTLVPGKKGDPNVYLYISSYNLSTTDLPNCALPHDKISIIKVPKRHPAAAKVVATPVIFPDGGYEGDGEDKSATTGCHDITVYADKDIAAGACMGDGVLFDISKRTAPKVITTVRDTVNFSFWHSATFNNSGTKVVFTDELGGGGLATCNERFGPKLGADAIYDIVGQRKLVFRSYFKIPRTNADTENCVAHNGSLIPVPGRDIMVQAWYQGGISVWDFTDSRRPKEIAYWERGPISLTTAVGGGSWSAYWYNGYIFSNDIAKGIDVLDLRDPRTNIAKFFRTNEFNAQTQNNFLRW